MCVHITAPFPQESVAIVQDSDDYITFPTSLAKALVSHCDFVAWKALTSIILLSRAPKRTV